MLDDDCGVCNEWPEFIGLEARIALEVVQECFFVGVIIRIYTPKVISSGSARIKDFLEVLTRLFDPKNLLPNGLSPATSASPSFLVSPPTSSSHSVIERHIYRFISISTM